MNQLPFVKRGFRAQLGALFQSRIQRQTTFGLVGLYQSFGTEGYDAKSWLT